MKSLSRVRTISDLDGGYGDIKEEDCLVTVRGSQRNDGVRKRGQLMTETEVISGLGLSACIVSL